MTIEALCGVAFLICAASLILKSIKPEYSNAVSAAGGIALLLAALGSVREAVSFISEITSGSGFSSYYAILLKALGVAFITYCAAEVCRDCGESSAGNKVELIGKLSILLLSLPVITNLLQMARELIK